jgi:tRNA(Ile)-lysidine synthase
MDGVQDQVRQAIEKERLLSRGDSIVVGVSGGPDSLCLLHLLHSLREEYELQLCVGHLDHRLRGAEAEADARFARELAEAWNLACRVERVDVPALARGQRLAVEEAARRARYTFLARLARETGAGSVAVGHNADDQAETVLMHWLRGSGLAGLRGMLPVTPLGDYRLLESDAARACLPAAGLRLIRPLLEVTRSEIEAYNDDWGLNPRFDQSNLDTTYFRNWLRHEVIPLLASHNPNVREVIRRSARVLAGDHALLRSLLEEVWPQVILEETENRISFALGPWRALPTSLQRSTLREAIHRLRWSLRNINFQHVEQALRVALDGTTGDQATLPCHLMMTLGYDRVIITDQGAGQPLPDWPLLPAGGELRPVLQGGSTSLPDSGWELEIQTWEREDLPGDWQVGADRWRTYADADAVGPTLWLRTRQEGDRFDPLGMDGRRTKLSDFLTNQKVPRAVRDLVPLVVDGQGIVWVSGLRLAERARVRDSTEKVLSLRFVRAGEPWV